MPPRPAKTQRVSAGLLMYRIRQNQIEVFLVHPGGPFFARKDQGAWSIPKGEVEPAEDLFAAALREFEEEIGCAPQAKTFLPLGEIRQKGGKIVHAWAFRGDWDNHRTHRCNTFQMEWPPGSSRLQEFPEIDQAAFFTLTEARVKLKETQHPFLDRLLEALGRAPGLDNRL